MDFGLAISICPSALAIPIVAESNSISSVVNKMMPTAATVNIIILIQVSDGGRVHLGFGCQRPAWQPLQQPLPAGGQLNGQSR